MLKNKENHGIIKKYNLLWPFNFIIHGLKYNLFLFDIELKHSVVVIRNQYAIPPQQCTLLAQQIFKLSFEHHQTFNK